MARFLVSLIGGMSLGGTYSLVALGIVLAFRATGTFNFAHGQFMVIPAFIIGAWEQAHRSTVWVSMLVGLVVLAAIGAAFYWLVLQRTTGLVHFMGVIATLGLAAILDGALVLVFGSPEYNMTISALPKGVVSIDGARFSSASLVLALFTLLLAGSVAAGMRFTGLGRRVRAAGQDPLLASQGGINVRRLYMASWAAAAVLAGIAGIAYGSANVVDFTMTNVALVAFPAILIGGMDSIEGAVLGGVIVGVFQGFVATYLSTQLLDVLTYSLLLVVMLGFPQGLLGTRQVRRV